MHENLGVVFVELGKNAWENLLLSIMIFKEKSAANMANGHM